MRLKRNYSYTDCDEFDNDYCTVGGKYASNHYSDDYTYDRNSEDYTYSDYTDYGKRWSQPIEDNYEWTASQDEAYDWNTWESTEAEFSRNTYRRKRGKIPILAALAAVITFVLIFALKPDLKTRPNAETAQTSRSVGAPDIQLPEAKAESGDTEGVFPATENNDAVNIKLLYYRSLLNDDEKQLYDIISDGIAEHLPAISEIRAKNSDQVLKIFRYVQIDHPEYFWLDGDFDCSYQSTEYGINAEITLNYTMDRQERNQMQRSVDAITEQIKQRFGGCSEYEKVKGVYEYLINNSVYDLSCNGQSILPVLVDGRGVCASYAESTQYLLQQLGIQAIVLDGDNHEWNIVRIDGEYYQLDTTWGDPVNEDGSQSIQYDYLCLTSQEMYLDHTCSGEFPVPDCTATDCNYFRKEGLFTSVYDENWLAGIFAQNIANRREVVFRVSDESVYQQYCNMLFDESRVFNIIEQINDPGVDCSNVSHSTNDKLYIIRIVLNYI